MRPVRILPTLLVLGCVLQPAFAAEPTGGDKRYPSLQIRGFGDFTFFATDEAGVEPDSGFEQGQFVLHFVSELAQTWNFFGEVSVTARDDEYRIEVERGFLKFDRSDYWKISMGRFHTPINWWNTAYHHGAWLQTSIDRPEMTRFGGQFIPVHFVGVIADGAIPSGKANLFYKAGLGNGRHENIARAGDAGDINSEHAWLVNLSSKPAFDLDIGAAYYRDRISASTLSEEYDEAITSFHVARERETPEVIAEWAHVDREGRATGQQFDSDAWYVQVAYRLRQWNALLKPYARYEEIDVPAMEPVFTTQTDREGWLAGVRMDVASFVAIKVEYRHQRSHRDPYVDSVWAQAAFVF